MDKEDEAPKKELEYQQLKCLKGFSLATPRSAYLYRRGNTPAKTERRSLFQVSAYNRTFKDSLRIFKCVRSKHFSIKGEKIHFQFLTQSDSPLYHAKFKLNADYIGISTGEKSHVHSTNFEAVLLHANSFCDFSLRFHNETGLELVTFTIRQEDSKSTPRVLTVFFNSRTPSIPNKMLTVLPRRNDDMKWEVELNSADTISSIKNCRLEDETHQHYLILRKVSRNTLEIETKCLINDICLFAIAIGSFLCKK